MCLASPSFAYVDRAAKDLITPSSIRAKEFRVALACARSGILAGRFAAMLKNRM